MQIQHNKEIEAFLARCKANLSKPSFNEYLDAYITKETEKDYQKALNKEGHPEFSGLEDTWPSLFLSTAAWLKNPYLQNIHLEEIQDENFSYQKEIVDASYLFNADEIQNDPSRELMDYMKLRALDEDYETLFLYQGKKDWMMLAPSESATNDPFAINAKGKVLLFGLGIGYVLYMCLQNKKVSEITVVEKDPSVIRLFQKALLPQMDAHIPIHLENKGALDVFRKEELKKYDSVFVDIYQSSEDGLDCMEKLLEQYVPAVAHTSFWIENSCTLPMRTLIYLHFEELYYNRTNAVTGEYEKRMAKTRAYFQKVDRTIEDTDTLKDFMYDPMVIRQILGTHL